MHRHQRDEKGFHFKCKLISPKVKNYYFQGNMDLLNKDILAIVWPRKMSELGKRILEDLFTKMQNYHLVTISGLAPGTDQFAHKKSIQNKIPTITILGGGIEWFRKHGNHYLLKEIISQGGLIISEYEPLFEPQKRSFPQRNRIIAGLANAIFIPEAGEKSGSLITANFGHKMQKPIYGTPGDIYTPQHRGLLQEIANKKIQICLDFDLMLNKHFQHQQQKTKHKTTELSHQEEEILNFFYENKTQKISTIIEKSAFSSQEVITIINILELKSLLYQSSPGSFILKN